MYVAKRMYQNLDPYTLSAKSRVSEEVVSSGDSCLHVFRAAGFLP